MEVLVKNTVDEKFRTSTVLAITHRLNTIRDFDRVIKIENGKAIEMPENFLSGIELLSEREEAPTF